MRLKGTAVSPGIAMGRTEVLLAHEIPVVKATVPEERVEAEVERLRRALEATVEEIRGQKEVARTRLSEDFLAIFDAHVVMLQDPALFRSAVQRIRSERVNAEYALRGAVQQTVRALVQSDDPYFRERALDLEDLLRRILLHLSGPPRAERIWPSEPVVILADALTPSETGTLHQAPVVGFATERGAKTSHTAIIARSLEIPAVVGVQGLVEASRPGSAAIVDGLNGEVILDPTEEERAEYLRRAEAYRRHRETILAHARKEARTADGHRVHVTANVDLLDEVKHALEVGASGVGLYRSEFLFLERAPSLPSEEDHAETYRRLTEAFYPHRVVFRTLDLGGEKYFHQVLDRGEKNPVLGVRALRFCLKHPELFKPQLRGILRASKTGNAAVLFPMVTHLQEFTEARDLLEICKAELRQEGVPFDENLPVGIMVEVPAAALAAHAFVPFVDFFSIGTNDLIQYLLAIDRNNEAVAHLYDPFHPAVLKCIDAVCQAASGAGKRVAVCGEAAADPAMVPLLVGLGVEELSMTPSAILEVKERVRGLSYRTCHRLARKALKARTGAEVLALMRAL
jgi:phosphotransferase system enzyme I (PtsI)